MSQWLKVHIAKPEDLSSETHMVEGENLFMKVILFSIHAHPPLQQNKYNLNCKQPSLGSEQIGKNAWLLHKHETGF